MLRYFSTTGKLVELLIKTMFVKGNEVFLMFYVVKYPSILLKPIGEVHFKCVLKPYNSSLIYLVTELEEFAGSSVYVVYLMLQI